MQKEGRERETQKSKMKLRHPVFPRGERSPWSSARPATQGKLVLQKGWNSDLSQWLWNKTREKPGNTSVPTPCNHKFQSTAPHHYNSREVLSGINLWHGGSLGSQCRQQSAWDFRYPRQQQLGWLRFPSQSHSQVLGWAPACRLKQEGSRFLKHLTGFTGAPDRAAHGQLAGTLSLEHPHPISPGSPVSAAHPSSQLGHSSWER